MLYALNKSQTNLFDEQISKHLEPALLETAKETLARIRGVRIAQEVKWDGGELDLLVYSESENKALHIQAKAPIAPQGARMVKATEDRVKEALDQLRGFRKLPRIQTDRIVGDAVGLKLQGVDLVDVVLCRASFGTAKVWERLGQVTALNPATLAAVVKNLERQFSQAPLAAFAETALRVTDDLQARITKGWDEATIQLGETSLTMPLLQLDYDIIRSELQLTFERLAARLK